MSYLKIWLGMFIGLLVYRLIFQHTDISFNEHVAGLYFSAIALAAHAFISRKWK